MEYTSDLKSDACGIEGSNPSAHTKLKSLYNSSEFLSLVTALVMELVDITV